MMYNSFHDFFKPVGSSVLDIEDIAAAAVHGEYVCVRSSDVRRLMFAISVLVAADTTLATMNFVKRSAPGVSAAEVSIGTLIIPDASAPGVVVYKDITPVQFAPGEVLMVEVSIAAVDGGGATGDGFYSFEGVDTPEEAVNETNMVKSA